MALTAAHRGYEYQDLLAAIRLVDVLLGSILETHVDKKLVPNDRFDDLTTVDKAGFRERIQIKHTDSSNRALTLATFTGDSRSLRLDYIISTALADRDGPGSQAQGHSFRIILCDVMPTDERLLSVLKYANPDPGPFFYEMKSVRVRFDADALWNAADSLSADGSLFTFLREGPTSVERADLDWVCERLVLELSAPAASMDLTTPGITERLLLERVRNEVGAELYPNRDRSVIDVSAALINAARAARQGTLTISPSELLRLAQIRNDFGAVAQAHPVDRTIEITRMEAVADLVKKTISAAEEGVSLLVVGSPGQGKSWICQQLIEHLIRHEWLVVDHYCYLGDADTERLPRVIAESVFGSLLGRIADQVPGVISNQRPRFAASEQALEGAVVASIQENPNRRVALVVDGIDHVTRVRGGGLTFDPSFALAEELAGLKLPDGSVLIVLSQPGRHLQPLETEGAVTVPIPNFSDKELRKLASRLGVISTEEPNGPPSPSQIPLLYDEEEIGEFLAALSERSRGNALYATYLCREALRTPSTMADPSETVRSLPQFDGNLLSYYEHIHASLGDHGAWVADVIALLNFPVSRSELKEIRPDTAHRVDRALDVLRPVLSERAAQGGIRVYHESFARFLRQPFNNCADAKNALLDRIVSWLEQKGMFEDSRAFRYLLPTLAEADHDQQVVDMVSTDFVVSSIAKGFPASEIINNLATAVSCASRTGNWPTLVRYIEMSRSAETYQDERFESSIVNFVDVIGTLLGEDVLAERLVHDGRPTMAATTGIQMCAAIDALGAVAPWREYMTTYLRESQNAKTSLGASSDCDVELAFLRGRLRLASMNMGVSSDSQERTLSQEERRLVSPIDWEKLAKNLDNKALPASEVVKAILDTYSLSEVNNLIDLLDNSGVYCLALANEIAKGDISELCGNAHDWALLAIERGLPPGSTQRLMEIGVNVAEHFPWSTESSREHLLDLTHKVQGRSIQFEVEPLLEWMDICVLAVRQDPLGLSAAEALLDGPGWYTCWLKFTIALVISENGSFDKQSESSLDALRVLTEVEDPFLGEPRACDLYQMQGIIDVTIHRAVSLLCDSDWVKALEIINQVSNSISTTIDGEMGGPISRDSLLYLAIGTATPTRANAAKKIINHEIANGGGHRFYSDLAEFRLIAARLALKLDDHAEAWKHWTSACQLLTAYGWHKDTTIFELLDPFCALTKIDRARARVGVAKLQPLCERVPMHTDGRETRHTRSRWWELFAAADPCALAEINHSKLLNSCNDPNWVMHDARYDLWHAWHNKADPIVAGALRLTLDKSLVKDDIYALSELADICDGTGTDGPSRLMGAVMTRIDERPYIYRYSNSEKLLEGDRKQVEKINLIAKRTSVSRVSKLPTLLAKENAPITERNIAQKEIAVNFHVDDGLMFPNGALGIAQAIRVWRRRSYEEKYHNWSMERFANILGYRMIELVEVGREIDANNALRLIADVGGYDNKYKLLLILAEGFERFGLQNLAVTAYVLSWTRARGHGGWTTFGGENEINSLKRGTQLDRELVLKTIAEEIDHIFSRGGYKNGITQALIYGFAKGGLGSGFTEAFDIWDEALSVISDRAPRVADSDDPEDIYRPPVSDSGIDIIGDIDIAFAQATIAGIAHASREQKRRSLLAIKILIDERPEVASAALNTTLTELSDPNTLTWLLRLIEHAGDSATPVVSGCRTALRDLMVRPHLVVRTIARRLLKDSDTPLAVSSDPDEDLLVSRISELILPDGFDRLTDDISGVILMVEEVAGDRLADAEQLLPGISEAVYKRVKTALEDIENKRKIKRQLDAYADRVKKRWPDAFLAIEEEIENAIQQAAAGARAAKYINGDVVNDPIEFEATLANALMNNSDLPFSIECTRQLRPNIPFPPQNGDSVWVSLRARAGGNSIEETNVEAACISENTLKGTISIVDAEAVPALEGGLYQGWRLVASVEQRMISSPDSENNEDDIVKRFRVVEIRHKGDSHALNLPPVSVGNLRIWGTQHIRKNIVDSNFRTQPIVGIDTTLASGKSRNQGLMDSTLLLTPTPQLFAAPHLFPGDYFALCDTEGPAIAMITWRTEYDSSGSHLTWPRLQGTGLIIRSDVFEHLVQSVQEPLILRDYLVGPESFGR